MKHLFLLAAVGCVLLSSCSSVTLDKGVANGASVGDDVPRGIYFIDADGNDIVSQTFYSGDHLLVFFSTKCGDCRQELPILQRLYDDYRDRVSFYLIDERDGYSDVSAYFESQGLTMPFVVSDKSFHYDVLSKSGRIPTCWFIRDGVIVGKWLDSPIMTEDDFCGLL